MAQWMFHVVVIERLVLDPFHNMIDLCSIANISVLALTHPLHGYYIHGRSVHGQADTDMAEMNQFLHKERVSTTLVVTLKRRVNLLQQILRAVIGEFVRRTRPGSGERAANIHRQFAQIIP